MSKNQSAKDIQVVPAKIAIRERVHLYTEGNTFSERWNWLVTEIVKSAANPEMGNHASQIVVIVQEDNTVTIKDNGRGLPVYCSNQQGTIFENLDQTRDQVIRPSIEFTLTSVYAGVPNRETYERIGFLFNIGTILASLSSHLQVTTCYNQKMFYMSFDEGGISELLTCKGSTNRQGTELSFRPSHEVFGSFTLDYQDLVQRCNEVQNQFGVVIECRKE